MIELHPADIAALAAYFVIVTVLGLWTARHVKNMAVFVMPRKFGKTLMIFYGFGSGTHSDQAVSVAAKSYLPWQMIFYLGAGLLAGIAASMVSVRPSKEKLDRFYALVRTPVQPGEVVDAPCTLPVGLEPAEARKLVPLASFEIYRPSRQMVSGFLAGWVAVAVLIGIVDWIVQG